MKIKRIFLGVGIIALVLLACERPPVPEPTLAPQPVASESPTLTPIPTWTSTPTSVVTVAPTVAPTSTPTVPSAPATVPVSPIEVDGVVHAILFYSPTCPHCHYVMEEALPPLRETYGAQLQVVEIDVSTPEGLDLYYAAIAHLDVPDERLGVPTMIVGEAVLVGAEEIPTLLPDLVTQGLDGGGIGWPEIPGFEPPEG